MESLIYFILLLAFNAVVSSKEECIAGKYHKKIASPETAALYPECSPWHNKTCCTAAFATELDANQTRKLYNHDWHRCQKLSAKCERFWINQVSIKNTTSEIIVEIK